MKHPLLSSISSAWARKERKHEEKGFREVCLVERERKKHVLLIADRQVGLAGKCCDTGKTLGRILQRRMIRCNQIFLDLTCKIEIAADIGPRNVCLGKVSDSGGTLAFGS